ncbi:Uncharacterized protein TCM_036498 [Theobroma cacao]|uniref:Uncharacterized protein n=1 Tax=Theobroma cacao TaxID=3641 RepID=A0A061FKA8_THECC|nr:Uncharacterized protein TCM_036498 [Theobroma cacao]
MPFTTPLMHLLCFFLWRDHCHLQIQLQNFVFFIPSMHINSGNKYHLKVQVKRINEGNFASHEDDEELQYDLLYLSYTSIGILRGKESDGPKWCEVP